MGLMAKAKRYDHGNRMLHVMSRSVHEDQLFPTDRFARLFWNEVGNRSLEFGVRILAMCLLGNHFHLILKGAPDAVSDTMHRGNSKLANVRNREDEKRRGALVGRRYNVVPVRDELHARRVIRYVPMNPVLHKLASDPAKWRWSTHAILVGKREAPEWFDRHAAIREFGFPDAASYERFVLQDSPLEPPPMSKEEAKQHQVLVLAQYGLTIDHISEVSGYTPRHVRRIIAQSSLGKPSS